MYVVSSMGTIRNVPKCWSGLAFRRVWAFLLGCLLCCCCTSARTAVKDAEAASHDDAAARIEPLLTYRSGDKSFKIIQFRLPVLSHYSYLIVSNGEGLLVDPARDIQAYLERAKTEKIEIRGVFLTHSHADFVAGHLEAARATGCKIYTSARARASYMHHALKDGDQLTIGAAGITFLETPGHTPDGMCALVAPIAAPASPAMLLTGDTLFVGSVGRPDLMGGTVSAAALAGMLYESWIGKLAPLPDSVLILPAHGAGSLCGANLSDNPSSTIGQEKATNVFLRHAGNRTAFVTAILEGLPQAPAYFSHNAQLNHDGPPLVAWNTPPQIVPATASLTDPRAGWVIDLRSAREFTTGHVPNSINIALRGRFETWIGTMIPWEAPLTVCGNAQEIHEALQRLHRVGYSGNGLLWESWTAAGLPVNKAVMITPTDLAARLQQGQAPLLADVRLPHERTGPGIGHALNLPLTQLTSLAPLQLDPAEPVVAICNSSYRSAMAIGLLKRAGFLQATSLDGGLEAWIEAKLPLVSPGAAAGADIVPPAGGSEATAAQTVGAAALPASGPIGTATGVVPGTTATRLPERISPVELRKLAKDLPNTFEIIDIRPLDQVTDYNPLQARQADIAVLLTHPEVLNASLPLILVDRDGSLAMMAAGLLAARTRRPLKALHGGLEAYWLLADQPRFTSPGGGFPGATGATDAVAPTATTGETASTTAHPAGGLPLPATVAPATILPVTLPAPVPGKPKTLSPLPPENPPAAKPKKKSAGC